MSKKFAFIIEAIVFLGLPVGLLMSSSGVMASRPLIIALGGFYVTWRLTSAKVSLSTLGIGISNAAISIKTLLLPSLAMILFTYLVFRFLPNPILQRIIGYDPLVGLSLGSRLVYYIFLSVPVQELIFRGYVTWRLLNTFKSQTAVTVISVLIFTLAHLPFYSLLMLVLTFIMALIYLKNYLQYRNLAGPIISHAIVGSLIILIRNFYFPY